MNIFEQIEVYRANPKDYLHYIFAKLIALSAEEKVLFEATNEQTQGVGKLHINLIINMLSEHFDSKLGSRLPVIAIYSIYEILMNKVERYKGKRLLPLQTHTSSDKHGFGDIEIYTADNQPFEVVEIKHNIPIDKYLIFDIAQKTQAIHINRYYILTTFPQSFADESSKQEVTDKITELNGTQGIDIIANGIISTLRYYLRFIDDYQEFITAYTNNLVIDAQNSTEVKSSHIEKWKEILQNYTSN